jgi:hypothetical protein
MNFNDFNSISDSEKKIYVREKMVDKGIYPMEQTIDHIINSTMQHTDGSKTQVDNYISLNLDIISSGEVEGMNKQKTSDTSFLTDTQIEERELQRAIALSLGTSNPSPYEGESFAESSKKAFSNDYPISKQSNVEDEDNDLQLAIALSLSQESNSDPSNLDKINNDSIDNINKGKGKSK